MVSPFAFWDFFSLYGMASYILQPPSRDGFPFLFIEAEGPTRIWR